MKYKSIVVVYVIGFFLLSGCYSGKKSNQGLFSYSSHFVINHLCDYPPTKPLNKIKMVLSPNLNYIFKYLSDTTKNCIIPFTVKRNTSEDWKLDKNIIKSLSIQCKSCNGHNIEIPKYERQKEVFYQKLKLLRLQENFLSEDDKTLNFMLTLESPYCTE